MRRFRIRHRARPFELEPSSARLSRDAISSRSGVSRLTLLATGVVATYAVAQTGGFFPPESISVPLAFVCFLPIAARSTQRELNRDDKRFLLALAIFGAVWTGASFLDGLRLEELSLAGSAVVFGAGYGIVRLSNQHDAVRVVASVGAIGSGLAIVGYFVIRERFALTIDGVPRLSGSFAYPNALALFAAVGLVGALATCASSSLIGRCASFLHLVVLLWTGSRGGLLAAGLGVAALGRFRISRQAAPAWCVLVASVLVVVGAANYRAVDSGRDRAAEWTAAFRAGASSPIVGVGPDKPLLIHNFRGDAVADFAHNEPLQVFAGAGLLGIGALALVVARAVAACRRRSALTAATFLTVAASGLLDFTWHSVAIAAFAGMYAAIDLPSLPVND